MSVPTEVAVCLLFALQREAAAFRRRFRLQRFWPGLPCAAWLGPVSGSAVLVLETGVGTTRTEAALQGVLDQGFVSKAADRTTPIVCTGFAGALQEGLRVGDVILATEVVEPGGHCWPVTWRFEGSLRGCPVALHPGRLLTMPTLVATPLQKHSLARQHGAVAVDMEAAAVAHFCQQQGLPFGCVRAISDDVHTALSPRLLALLAQGRASPFRVGRALVRTPGLVGELWRLARNTRFAADQLAQVLGELPLRASQGLCE